MTTIALVVDDEADICRLIQMTLTRMGIKCDVAYDLQRARDYLSQKVYDFCLTDLRLPDGSGLDLVKQVSALNSTPIAVITAHGSVDLAIEALKLGAFDFVNKPLELPRLRQLVESALKVIKQSQELPEEKNAKSPEQQLLDERLIGNSPAMLKLKGTIQKLARSQAPVFLWGASGTGKEVVARLIHDLSPRREGSFVPVNCGAIPSELMESEFFGHKKGSFTGATTDKQGLFQQANGGTLFLDEVADLPLAMQVKLLRAIQEKTVRAIGDTKEVPVDIRILSATHKDLNHLVQTGAFRQDLFYRINVIELKLPTLNERREDIPTLASHFLQLIAHDWQLDTAPTLSNEASERLKNHDFEGNVRELRNLLERAVTMTESNVIDVVHLGNSVCNIPTATVDGNSKPQSNNQGSLVKNKNYQSTSATSSIQYSTNIAPTNIAPTNLAPANIAPTNVQAKIVNPTFTTTGLSSDTSATDKTDNKLSNTDNSNPPEQVVTPTETNSSTNNATSNQDNNANSLPQEGLEAYLQEQEKQLIITALNKANWNKTRAAKLLGTTFRSLRYRMKKLEIDNDSTDDEES